MFSGRATLHCLARSLVFRLQVASCSRVCAVCCAVVVLASEWWLMCECTCMGGFVCVCVCVCVCVWVCESGVLFGVVMCLTECLIHIKACTLNYRVKLIRCSIATSTSTKALPHGRMSIVVASTLSDSQSHFRVTSPHPVHIARHDYPPVQVHVTTDCNILLSRFGG